MSSRKTAIVGLSMAAPMPIIGCFYALDAFGTPGLLWLLGVLSFGIVIGGWTKLTGAIKEFNDPAIEMAAIKEKLVVLYTMSVTALVLSVSLASLLTFGIYGWFPMIAVAIIAFVGLPLPFRASNTNADPYACADKPVASSGVKTSPEIERAIDILGPIARSNCSRYRYARLFTEEVNKATVACDRETDEGKGRLLVIALAAIRFFSYRMDKITKDYDASGAERLLVNYDGNNVRHAQLELYSSNVKNLIKFYTDQTEVYNDAFNRIASCLPELSEDEMKWLGDESAELLRKFIDRANAQIGSTEIKVPELPNTTQFVDPARRPTVPSWVSAR